MFFGSGWGLHHKWRPVRGWFSSRIACSPQVVQIQGSQQTVKEEHPIDPAHLELKYQCRRQHAAMIMIMDEVVGNITKALQHKNMWKDTLMIFSSVPWNLLSILRNPVGPAPRAARQEWTIK